MQARVEIHQRARQAAAVSPGLMAEKEANKPKPVGVI
jgi:hypothetical protein